MMEQNKQMTFLSNAPAEDDFKNSPECESVEPTQLKLFIDGAARNNPGPAGAGICLKRGAEILVEQGFFLGSRTNNQAEYFGLLIGIYFAQQYLKKHEHLTIHSDSQLLVRQMSGIYKVRDPLLKQMQGIAKEMLGDYTVRFCHIYREHNTRADAMANRGIDKMVPLPKKFIDLMQHYKII